MMRTITNIKVIANKYGKTVYVDFDNGYFGTWYKDAQTKRIAVKGLSDEELAEAKRLAMVDRRWQNWRRPCVATGAIDYRRSDSEEDNAPITPDEMEMIRRNQPGESEMFG